MKNRIIRENRKNQLGNRQAIHKSDRNEKGLFPFKKRGLNGLNWILFQENHVRLLLTTCFLFVVGNYYLIKIHFHDSWNK